MSKIVSNSYLQGVRGKYGKIGVYKKIHGIGMCGSLKMDGTNNNSIYCIIAKRLHTPRGVVVNIRILIVVFKIMKACNKINILKVLVFIHNNLLLNDMPRPLKVICILFCTVALKSEAQRVKHLQPTPGHAVGDITFDDKIDDKGFYVCNAGEIFQYYSLSLTNSAEFKRRAQKQILRLKPSSTLDASGYLTIRFIVNCEGKADRFRILGVDNSYKPHRFDSTLTGSLLKLIKNYDAWQPGKFEGDSVDYYQIITFRIIGSRIADILP